MHKFGGVQAITWPLISPGDGEPDLVCNSQDPLQVLGAEGAGFPEGDSRGEALDDDRVGVVLDPLVRHLDRVLDAQRLAVLPVEEILDLLSQRVGQVDPGQFGLQTLWRRDTFRLDWGWLESPLNQQQWFRPPQLFCCRWNRKLSLPENPGRLDKAAPSSVTGVASLASSSLGNEFETVKRVCEGSY